MSDMTDFEQAVDQVIEDSERLHKVVNGTGSETVIVEDGSEIPTVRKALVDNLYYKTPPLPWIAGSYATVFNQLYAYNGATGVQWWYAPGATAAQPIALPTNPTNNVNWRLYTDSGVISANYAPINSPIFTGNPQAPTPALNSNSTTIATTAFVTLAIAAAIAALQTGSASFANLTVTAMSTLNNLVVNGTATFNGGVNAENTTGRFQNIVMTKQASTFTFEYEDPSNPAFIQTEARPYAMQTHTLTTDIIVNGTAAADNTTMSLTGVGNNVFDYVYIKGNNEKGPAEPRLTVSGTTLVENLTVTGTVTGITLSVNGLDITPNSVTTTEGVNVGGDLVVGGTGTFVAVTVDSLGVINELTVTGLASLDGGFNTGTGNGVVGGDLTVSGTATFAGISINDLTVGDTLTVGGLSTLNGGFTTTTGNGAVGGDLTVGGDTTVEALTANGRSTLADVDVGGTLTVATGAEITGNVLLTGDLTETGNLTVTDDVVLNSGGAGTTTVNNLVVNGTVSGITFDLTGQNITVATLAATGVVSAGSLSISGDAVINGVTTVTYLEMSFTDVPSSTATWTPSGTSNIYTVTVDADLTIGAWPRVTSVDDKPNAFSAMIYLFQDATGHAVTLDPSYGAMSSTPISTAANSVTVLQLVYCGKGDIVDVIVGVRP